MSEGDKSEDAAGTDWANWQQRLLNPRLIFAAGIVVALIGATLYLISGPSWLKHVFHHAPKPAIGYTLTPPPGWQRVQPTPQGASVAFESSSTETDAGGTLQPFMVVQSRPLSGSAQKLTFSQLTQEYLSQIAQGYTNYHQQSATEANIAGTPALLVTYSFTQDGTAATAESLFMVKHGLTYDVIGSTLASTWSQHAAEIQKSLLTFRP